MAKSFLRFSKASGSTKRRIEAIIRAGEHTARRALASWRRRKLYAPAKGVDGYEQ
jgi:hypothetical protein